MRPNTPSAAQRALALGTAVSVACLTMLPAIPRADAQVRMSATGYPAYTVAPVGSPLPSASAVTPGTEDYLIRGAPAYPSAPIPMAAVQAEAPAPLGPITQAIQPLPPEPSLAARIQLAQGGPLTTAAGAQAAPRSFPQVQSGQFVTPLPAPPLPAGGPAPQTFVAPGFQTQPLYQTQPVVPQQFGTQPVFVAPAQVAQNPGDDLVRMSGEPAFLTFGGGITDITKGDEAANFRLEYRHNQKLFWQIKPFIGVDVASDGAFYGYFGLLADLYFGRRFVLTPNLALGGYSNGDKDLGYPLEFRSGFEFAYRFDDRSRLGIAFHHISNANIGERNPGTEQLMLNYSLPFDKVLNLLP